MIQTIFKEIKVLVVGLGNIGMGYDFDLLPNDYILSHSQAFNLHPFFKIVGGVDINQIKREMFENKFKCSAFKNIKDAFSMTSPELVVVSTPTETICKIISKILKNHDIKFILCEKPVSYNFECANKVFKEAKKKNCKIFINYPRRSDIGVQELRKKILNKDILFPITGHVWYSKGLYNSGSHFINLLQYLFGSVKKINSININKFNKKEVNPDFKLFFSGVNFTFEALDSRNFFHNEFELVSKNCRVRYERGGAKITINYVEQNKEFKINRLLSNKKHYLISDYYKMQWYVVNELSKFFKGSKCNLSFDDDALETLRVLKGIENKYE